MGKDSLARSTGLKRWMLMAGALLAICALVAAPGFARAATPTPTPANPLDARLGGTDASFAASYGQPATTDQNGTLLGYTVQGFGLVAAAFRNGNAYEVTIAADRLDHNPLTEPDPKDWTVQDASQFAQYIVPDDAKFNNPVTATDKITIVGHSKALESAFTTKDLRALGVGGTRGDLAIVFNLDTAGAVYAVDAMVGNGQSVAAATAASGSGGTSKSTTKTPTATTSGGVTGGAGASTGELIHCKDFKTQKEAQAYFDSHGGDSNPAVAGMDGDHDGKACEILP